MMFVKAKKKAKTKAKKPDQLGFSLLECIFALVITVIGLTAVLGLVVEAIRLQTFSRDAVTANAIAKAKIEELRNYAPTATQRARGGSLTSNTANYNDSPNDRFRRRWRIETHPTDAGVPAGTQRVTVTSLANRPDVRLPDIQIQVLMPQS